MNIDSKRIRLLCLAVLIPISLVFLCGLRCCKPAVIGSLPVELHPQETGMWCWAASGQMVMDYLGHDVAQCTQANNEFGHTDCPCNQCGKNPVVNPPCVFGGWTEFDKYGFTFKRTTDAPLSWDDIKCQISNEPNCKAKPFAFTWHWLGGGGHVMVIKGYITLNGVNYVAVLDPSPVCVGGQRIDTYDRYVAQPGHHTHWDDFYDVTYTGGH